ncbi:protein kinase [Actinomadura sp. SCN-SB]|uniref:protein kinase domain-containing protein n=1 Tax=Actinomadura sp. SCN-SB TaxID=3373092 RepID=UPI003752F78C
MTSVRPLLPSDPERLGPYQVKGRLGEGGQSVVFLAEGEDGREVAIKLLRASLSRNPEWRARFEREMELIGRVAGFCTAQVLDADVSGELPYVVSEYVPGPSLTELVGGDAGPRTGTDLDRLAIGTVTALAAIHRAGILHRDFKPANVLMGPDGPRVIDFGIARVMGSAAAKGSGVVGTPSYMAPEQVTDGELGPGVDMFAWGSTMLFAATGRHPFGNDTISAVFHRVLNYEPDMSALPDSLRTVVAACLAKDPAYRPGAQEALLELLGSQDTVAAEPEGALTTGASFAGGAPAGSFAGQGGFGGPAGFGIGPGGFGAAAEPGPPPGGPGAPPVPGQPVTFPPHHTIPPGSAKRRLRIAVAVAATLVLLAGGGAAYALASGGKGDPRPSPSASPVADVAVPPAGTAEATRTAGEAIKAVLSFDYRRIDQDIAAAHARITQRYRAEYDRQLETSNWRTQLRDRRSTISAAITDSAVIASSGGTVTVLSFVKRTVTAADAQPNLLNEPMRVTMVRRGASWLLDTFYVLRADSVPRLASAGDAWPRAKGRALIDAVNRSRPVTSGTPVETAVRPGGPADRPTALVVVGECAKDRCRSDDKISMHRLELRRQGQDGWQVARTERL